MAGVKRWWRSLPRSLRFGGIAVLAVTFVLLVPIPMGVTLSLACVEGAQVNCDTVQSTQWITVAGLLFTR